MRYTRRKVKKEPEEPSPRTLSLLLSWEAKYGLDVIRQHLDEGLFSHDPAEKTLCYRWLEQRHRARRNNLVVQAVMVILAGAIVCGLIWFS